MYYKAPNNSIHFLESSSFTYLLPIGSVEITDEEAKKIIDLAKKKNETDLLTTVKL
jgi:hypothetical protein